MLQNLNVKMSLVYDLKTLVRITMANQTLVFKFVNVLLKNYHAFKWPVVSGEKYLQVQIDENISGICMGEESECKSCVP